MAECHDSCLHCNSKFNIQLLRFLPEVSLVITGLDTLDLTSIIHVTASPAAFRCDGCATAFTLFAGN